MLGSDPIFALMRLFIGMVAAEGKRTSGIVMVIINDFGCKRINHPPNCLQLASSDLPPFPKLKMVIYSQIMM
jgi:hypothetical protein